MRRRYIAVLAVVAAVALLSAVVMSGAAAGKKGGKRGKGGTPQFASMSGKNEIGPTGKKRAGDPDGLGSFGAVIHGGQKLCFGIAVTGISDPVGAHVHKGKRNKNGPIVITLSAPSSGDPGASSGCVDADSTLLGDISKHRSRYYVNVHTADFPGGAVRGQLFKRPPR